MAKVSATWGLRAGEWLAALVGALSCVLVPALFSAQQNTLPFPGLYFIQIALVGLGVLGFVATRAGRGSRWVGLPWVAAGIILAFVVLGGFSIGPYLIPAFLAFMATGVLIDLQTGGPKGQHFGYLLVAAVVQTGLMGLMILV